MMHISYYGPQNKRTKGVLLKNTIFKVHKIFPCLCLVYLPPLVLSGQPCVESWQTDERCCVLFSDRRRKDKKQTKAGTREGAIVLSNLYKQVISSFLLFFFQNCFLRCGPRVGWGDVDGQPVFCTGAQRTSSILREGTESFL